MLLWNYFSLVSKKLWTNNCVKRVAACFWKIKQLALKLTKQLSDVLQNVFVNKDKQHQGQLSETESLVIKGEQDNMSVFVPLEPRTFYFSGKQTELSANRYIRNWDFVLLNGGSNCHQSFWKTNLFRNIYGIFPWQLLITYRMNHYYRGNPVLSQLKTISGLISYSKSSM